MSLNKHENKNSFYLFENKPNCRHGWQSINCVLLEKK